MANIFKGIELNAKVLSAWFDTYISWQYDITSNVVHFFRDETKLIESVNLKDLQKISNLTEINK